MTSVWGKWEKVLKGYQKTCISPPWHRIKREKKNLLYNMNKKPVSLQYSRLNSDYQYGLKNLKREPNWKCPYILIMLQVTSRSKVMMPGRFWWKYRLKSLSDSIEYDTNFRDVTMEKKVCSGLIANMSRIHHFSESTFFTTWLCSSSHQEVYISPTLESLLILWLVWADIIWQT